MESSTGIAIAFVAQIAAFSAILGLLTSCTDYSPTRFDLVEEPKTMGRSGLGIKQCRLPTELEEKYNSYFDSCKYFRTT
jgi:hypothetical protein